MNQITKKMGLSKEERKLAEVDRVAHDIGPF